MKEHISWKLVPILKNHGSYAQFFCNTKGRHLSRDHVKGSAIATKL